MKNIILMLTIGLLTIQAANAQSNASKAGNKPVQTSFKVYGNCPQCKSRIEGALDVKGIRSAEWNIKTKMLEVVYVPDKISLEQVHKLVAAVGHDTDIEKAPDAVYLKLPDCCMFRENDNTHFD